MIFSQQRETLRKMYADAWRKAQAQQALSPLEAQIAAVVAEHPEYHAAVNAADAGDIDRDYRDESNPFLHMGLHLGIREQVATDRPAGIAAIYRQLVAAAAGDAHHAEHQMLECLAATLHEAQRLSCAPDERRYMERLRGL